MQYQDSYGPPTPEEQPVWDISSTSKEPINKRVQAPKPEEKSPYLLGSPLLSGSLFLALLAYFLNGSEWMKSVERFIAGKNKTVSAEPYRQWAAHHPMGYDEVAVSPESWTGKAVIWEIVRSPAGNYFYQSNGNMPVAWSRREDELETIWDQGLPAKILARIEGSQENAVLLMFLQLL